MNKRIVIALIFIICNVTYLHHTINCIRAKDSLKIFKSEK